MGALLQICSSSVIGYFCVLYYNKPSMHTSPQMRDSRRQRPTQSVKCCAGWGWRQDATMRPSDPQHAAGSGIRKVFGTDASSAPPGQSSESLPFFAGRYVLHCEDRPRRLLWQRLGGSLIRMFAAFRDRDSLRWKADRIGGPRDTRSAQRWTRSAAPKSIIWPRSSYTDRCFGAGSRDEGTEHGAGSAARIADPLYRSGSDSHLPSFQ